MILCLWLMCVAGWQEAVCCQSNVQYRKGHTNWMVKDLSIASDSTDFPIKRLLTGATRIGKTLFDGRKYHKPESFSRAQQDFRSLNLRNVQEVRDGLWVGRVQNKMVRLDKLYNDRARIQVYPDRFGAPPILSVEYDITRRPMDAFVDLCNLVDNCHNP